MEKALNKRATTFRTECTKGLRWNYYNLGGGHHRAEEWSWDCWYWYSLILERGQADLATQTSEKGATVCWSQCLWGMAWYSYICKHWKNCQLDSAAVMLLRWRTAGVMLTETASPEEALRKERGRRSPPYSARPPLALWSPTSSHCYQSPIQSVGKVKCRLQSSSSSLTKR